MTCPHPISTNKYGLHKIVLDSIRSFTSDEDVDPCTNVPLSDKEATSAFFKIYDAPYAQHRFGRALVPALRAFSLAHPQHSGTAASGMETESGTSTDRAGFCPSKLGQHGAMPLGNGL